MGKIVVTSWWPFQNDGVFYRIIPKCAVELSHSKYSDNRPFLRCSWLWKHKSSCRTLSIAPYRQVLIQVPTTTQTQNTVQCPTEHALRWEIMSELKIVLGEGEAPRE